MAELNIMPIYTDAWAGDVGDLPNELYGAYFRLLVRWWREGALPEKNERRLARWAGLSTTDFDDLKDFLSETEKGWIQKKLMKTYAKSLEKSVKAQKSADARYNRADAPEIYEERISAGYSDRLPPDMLSVIRYPIGEGSNEPSPEEKKIKTKKRKTGGADVSRGTLSAMLPDGEADREAAQKILAAIGERGYVSFFQRDGCSAVSATEGGRVLIAARAGVTREMMDTRFSGTLNDLFGRGGWAFHDPPAPELVQLAAE